jgi:hypothetical protein
MSNEKFTVEPLEVSKNDDNGETVIREKFSGRILANLECDRCQISDEEIKANAHLFAASKDMYEALKGILEAYGVSKYSNLSMWKKGIEALEKANPQQITREERKNWGFDSDEADF